MAAVSARANAVELRGVSVAYDRRVALEAIDLVVAPGEALGIVGPNGSGKSTLLKAIAGLLPIQSGSLAVFGVAPHSLPAGSIAYVPQLEAVDWKFPVSVGDVVAMGRYAHLRPLARFSAADRAAVAAALSALGLTELRDRHISQLSGGQQQRVFVARALAQEPRLLLLDEPTTGVDARTEDDLCAVVRDLVKHGMPILMATHDLDRAGDWFDRLMVLDRRVLALGDPETVLASGAYAGIREHTHTHGHRRTEEAP